MYLHMRNAAKRSHRQASVESPLSPSGPGTDQLEREMSPVKENTDSEMDTESSSDVPPTEVFGQVNKGMCETHASSLSPQTTINSLSHFSQALGPQNMRKRSFPLLCEEENRPLYTILDPKAKFDKENCRITSLCYTTGGELVVADAANSKVKVFDNRGQLKVECIIPVNLGKLVLPVSVACSQTSEIVIADKGANDLKVFTPDGHYLTSFGGELKKPCGVAVNNQGHVIVVAEGCNKIFIFKKIASNEFTTISRETKDIKKDNNTKGLSSVGVSKSGNIVVVDECSKAIYVYDSFGKFMSKYVHEEPNQTIGARRPSSLVSSYSLGQLKLPTSIANDHHGNVFIADEENGKILHFDLINNAFTRQIISKEDGIDKPWMIAASKFGQLAVVERHSDLMKIYNVSHFLKD